MGYSLPPLSPFSFVGNFWPPSAVVDEIRGASPDVVAKFGGQVWQTPSLLQPRADVAEKLSSALAVAAALERNRSGGEKQLLAIGSNSNPVAPRDGRTSQTLMFAPADAVPPRGERPPSKEDLKKSWEKIPWYLRWGTRDSFEYVLRLGNKSEKVFQCLEKLLKEVHEMNFRSKIAMSLTFRKVIWALATALELDFTVPIVGVVVRGDMDDKKWDWMDPEAMRAGQDFAKWFSNEFPNDVEIHIPLGIKPVRGMTEY